MWRNPRLCALMGAVLVALGCNSPAPTTAPEEPVRRVSKRQLATPSGTVVPSPSAGTLLDPPASPQAGPTQDPAATGTGALATPTPAATGTLQPDAVLKVTGAGGQPAVGVTVRFYPSQEGAPAAYRGRRLLATVLYETTSDLEGRFSAEALADASYNIEAVEGQSSKAFAFGVPVKRQSVTLQLAPTGSVSGTLKLPGATDHSGITVRLLGTPYIGTTDTSGVFTLADVPAGTYQLYGERDGATYTRQGVAVTSSQDTPVAEAQLSSLNPVLSTVEPTSGGRGLQLTVRGQGFVAGKPLGVKFGTFAGTATRIDDTTLTLLVPPVASTSLVISVDGRDSNAIPFTPITSLLVPNPPAEVRLNQAASLTVQAFNEEAPVPNPAVTWVAEGAVSVDANGVVTGTQVGAGRVWARSGEVTSAEVSLQVLGEISVTTVAGNGQNGVTDGPAAEAGFRGPAGLALEPTSGDLYITDFDGQRIRRLTPGGQVATVAGSDVAGWTDDTGVAAAFNFPIHISLDPVGGPAFLVSDVINHRVRRVTPGGLVTTLAGGGPIGIDENGEGGGYEDGPALDARFRALQAARRGPDGSIYISDTLNNRIRRLDGAGAVTTVAGSGVAGADNGTGVAASFSGACDLAIAGDGTVYIADTNNDCIRQLAPDGAVTTLAGGAQGLRDGQANEAEFFNPFGLALDPVKNRLYVSELGNHAIREIDLAADPPVVRTICGGTQGFADGNQATAQLDSPHGLALDAQGRLYVADYGNRRIRRITLDR
ncbi:MAG: IPT/TIG domain-containing protein [Candidatus Sericytochromatia bacterium]|nr:IPT/TIG domain-containing protein [Candidatus Sericytochromatia bacterium]